MIMAGRNFEKYRQRRNMTDRGSESAKGGMPLLGTPKQRPDKAALRELAAQAVASVGQVKRAFECRGCGRSYIKLQPIEKPSTHPPCPRCGGAT